MRNLKRVLSLTLASVMLLGMMVVGASAADYSDVDYAEDNVEAIEVLNAINVMTGDAGKDTFRPGDEVSRGEMARIMAALMDLDYDYYIGANPFTDMVGHWAEGYAAACAANGIIYGRTPTIYDPSATVTTVEASAMLMRALGYFQYASDTADGFEISTIRQAGRIDLFDGVNTKTNEPMTRNDVAQLVLNTLKSGMVEPDDNTLSVTTTVGDATTTVQGGRVNYVYVTSREKYATSIRKDEATDATATTNLKAPIVDLGEKLYKGDLTRAEIPDDLGRPAQHWEYKTKEIGTYADAPDYAFSAKVTSKKLYDTIGAIACDYKWEVYMNGEQVDYDGADLRANRVDDDKCFLNKGGVVRPAYATYTDNGVVTEVFVDDTVETNIGLGKVIVAVYNIYAAEVMRVIESDGTIVLTDLDQGPATAAHEFETDLFDEDDIVVYTFSTGADKIQAVALAQRIEGEITRVRTGIDGEGKDDDRSGDLFIVDGTTYNYNATVDKGNRLQTETVNNNMVGYLDEFGYCVYIDKAAVTYDYAYVLSAGTDSDRYGSKNENKTIYARLAFTDGTTASVETDNAPGKWLNKDGSVKFEEMIVSYSVDKNGIYTLTPANNYWYDEGAVTVTSADLEINNNVSSFTDGNKDDNGKYVRYSANSNTSFVLITTDEDGFSGYSYSAYTGVAHVPDVEGVKGSKIAVATESGSRVAKAVFVLDGNVSGGDVYFIRANKEAKLVRDSEIGNYYEINAFMDGAAVTLKVKSASSAATNLVTGFNVNDARALKLSGTTAIFAADAITENADGLVTGVHLYNTYYDGDGVTTGVGTDKTNRNVIILGMDTDGDGLGDAVQERFTYESGAVFTQWITRNNVGKFEASRANAIKNDNNDEYIAVTDGDVITGICVKYVVDGEGKFDPDYDDSKEPGTKPPVTDPDADPAVVKMNPSSFYSDARFYVVDAETEELLADDEIFVGMTIILDPAEALTISEGAEDNEDGTWTITDAEVLVDSKDEDVYGWSTVIADGWFKMEGGLPVTIEPEYGPSFVGGVARLARAAGDAETIRTIRAKGGSFDATITLGEGKTATYHCEYPGGGANATVFKVLSSTLTAKELVRGISQIGSESGSLANVVIKSGSTEEPSADPKTYDVQASVPLSSGTHTVATFMADYKPGETGRVLTVEEITGAINRTGYVVEKVDLSTNTITATLGGFPVEISIEIVDGEHYINGNTVVLRDGDGTNSTNSYELMKIEYPGKTLYLPEDDDQILDEITAGIDYLIDSTLLGKNAVDDADLLGVNTKTHEAVVDVEKGKDKKYAEAFKVVLFDESNTTVAITASSGVIDVDGSNDISGVATVAKLLVAVSFPGVNDKAPYSETAHAYLQKGAVLSFSQASGTNVEVGQTLVLTKNNVTPASYKIVTKNTIPTVADVVVDSSYPVGSAPSTTLKTNNQFTLMLALRDAAYNVTLNDVPMTPDKDDPTLFTAYIDTDLVDRTVIYENSGGMRVALTKGGDGTATPTAGQYAWGTNKSLDGKIVYKVLNTQAWNTAAKNGDELTIKLYTAYEVYGPASDSGADIGAYTNEDDGGSIYRSEADAHKMVDDNDAVPDKAVITTEKDYVKTSESKKYYLVADANSRWAWKDTGTSKNIKETEGKRELPDPITSTYRVWEITVDRTLNKDLITTSGGTLTKDVVVDATEEQVIDLEGAVTRNTKKSAKLSDIGITLSNKVTIDKVESMIFDTSNNRKYLFEIGSDKKSVDIYLTAGTNIAEDEELNIAKLRITLSTGDFIDVMVGNNIT